MKDDVSMTDIKNDCMSVDYESEYKRLYEENINLKIENETLKETIVKLAVRM